MRRDFSQKEEVKFNLVTSFCAFGMSLTVSFRMLLNQNLQQQKIWYNFRGSWARVFDYEYLVCNSDTYYVYTFIDRNLCRSKEKAT